jgi:hypothetical protein
MKNNFAKVILALTLTLAGISAYGQGSVMLKFGYKEGQKYRTTIEVNIEIVQTMMGQTVPVTSKASSQSTTEVMKVDEKGNAALTLTVEDFQMKTSAMGQVQEKTKSDFPLLNFQMIQSPTGKTLSVKSGDETKQVGEVKSLLRNFTKAESLPGREVKIGEKWQEHQVDTVTNLENNPISQMINESDIEYVLAGKETKDGKELYKINFKGKLNISGQGAQNGMDLFMEGTGEMSGFFYFDSSLSTIVHSEADTEVNTSIAIKGPQNMTIPMNQTIKIVAKVEPA